MPLVGCDAKPPRTTSCPQTRSARIIAQQARVTDPLMVQCWYSFYDAGTALAHQWVHVSGFLGPQLPLPYSYFILQHFVSYITACDD